jgi:predicted DNA binding CopG/RHH family protein
MKKDTSVNIRLTSAERDELQRRADAAKRTLADYIRLILQTHLEAEPEDTGKSERRKR